MTTVIKRNNGKERFSEDKIRKSIEAAAKDAKIPLNRISRLVDSVSREVISSAREEKDVRSVDLRSRILDRLDRTEPTVSRSWRDFDRRTKGIT